MISKLLVLKDSPTREEYFRQQSEFVTEHGRGDEFTEFSTDIQGTTTDDNFWMVPRHSIRTIKKSHQIQLPTTPTVPGYRPRMLAVRSIKGISSARLFRLHLFWFFTFCGLTVPYRIWFKRHCDSLRVIVVKETSAVPPGSSYWDNARQWIPYTATITPPSPTTISKSHSNHDTHFRNFMKGRFLYGDESSNTRTAPSSTTTAPATSQPSTPNKALSDQSSTPNSPVPDQ